MNKFHEECIICYNYIDNIYVKIDGENGIYHLKCLNEWLKKSNYGILTHNIIQSYTIYCIGYAVTTINRDTQELCNYEFREKKRKNYCCIFI
jgi:hypothetical protein